MKSETVYFAGSWARKNEIAVFADKVKELGYWVRCRWLNAGGENNTPESWEEYAERDAEDIYANGPGEGIFVLFTEQNPPDRNSRLVELGYALAYGKAVYVIGPIETIFCTLAEEICATKEDCFIALQERAKEG